MTDIERTSPAASVVSKVILVYQDNNSDGRERVRQLLQSMCRVTLEFSLQDKLRIHMCKAAWPMLSTTSLDVKVISKIEQDTFKITATGSPGDSKSFIELIKSRINSIEFRVKRVPNHKKTFGLLLGLQQASNELLARNNNVENDNDNAGDATDESTKKSYVGYTSCYIDKEGIGLQTKVRMVTVTFLPPDSSDDNVDHEAERQAYEGMYATISDVIDSYYETVCYFRNIRKGVNTAVVKAKYSLYFVQSNNTEGSILLCGEYHSVRAAVNWLTEVPAAEKLETQLFKVQDGRVAWMLTRYQHAKMLEVLRRAVTSVTLPGSSQRVSTTELVNRAQATTALFAVKGPSALVEAAIAEGRSVEAKWVETFVEKYLLENELDEAQLTFLKNEGFYLVKKIRSDYAIYLKYVSAFRADILGANSGENEEEGGSSGREAHLSEGNFARISSSFRTGREIASKEGFKIFGPKEQVMGAENEFREALNKSIKVTFKPIHFQFTEPEEWEKVLQRIRLSLWLHNSIVLN